MNNNTNTKLAEYLARNYGESYAEMDRPKLSVTWNRWCADDGFNLYSKELGCEFYGQAAQDLFTLFCLKNKSHGRFMEIGSNDPVFINNTFLLETRYQWKGVMVEYLEKFLEPYQNLRPNSHYLIGDARTFNYQSVLHELAFPADMDYLQIDLEWVGSYEILSILDQQIFDDYRFAVVTYEHDHKNKNERLEHKKLSREVFSRRGYIPVFLDVMDVSQKPYEDWYVHPELVDMSHINRIKSDISMTWKEITQELMKFQEPL